VAYGGHSLGDTKLFYIKNGKCNILTFSMGMLYS